MTGRSLQASTEGIEKAEKALRRNSLTKKALAEHLGISRSTVTNFFSKKSVDRLNFEEICQKLGLEWQEIVTVQEAQDSNFELDALVQQVRQKVRASIQERCGTMRVLDMSQPIGLSEIYTDVNILETISGCRRKTIDDLWQGCTAKSFDRFGLGKVTEKRVLGLTAVERYSKLIVLGKPGAGKTTFLKHLAIECSGDKFQSHRVPIFITLKQFAEAEGRPNLLKYISQMFVCLGVAATDVEQLMSQGRALILLDGLDEVRAEDSSTVLNHIRDFSNQYSANQFVITCRIAAQEYTFEKFTEVEVADFDSQQIGDFAEKWFQTKDAVKSEQLITKLESNEPIKELATNPLLLTLLCLVFEDSASFPSNRSELYKEGLDILLKKWDAKRNIERDQIYKKLSLQRKEDLLSKIALTTFKQGDYFFKQQELEQQIREYIRNLPDAQTEPELFQLDVEAVLKSIEAQHGLLVERARGIYSFSHLTFQEYFTARGLVGGHPQGLEELASHIAEKPWREIFLLAVGMMQSADQLLLLMKEQIDALIVDDGELQQLLSWANQKSCLVKLPYKPGAVRAFYLSLFRLFYQAFSRAFDPARGYSRTRRFALNLTRVRTLAHAPSEAKEVFNFDFNLDTSSDPAYVLACILAFDFEPELKQALQQLIAVMPDPDKEKEIFEQWKQSNGEHWIGNFRMIMIHATDIEHNWQFSNRQNDILKQYIESNKLLIDCLNSDCYVSIKVRNELENWLLLLP
jgi:predicted NACHT family NTPase